jgi:hypothetical protein
MSHKANKIEQLEFNRFWREYKGSGKSGVFGKLACQVFGINDRRIEGFEDDEIAKGCLQNAYVYLQMTPSGKHTSP